MVLVGRNSIDAVNLEDGSKAWGGRAISMPSGAAVCGHGFYAGGQYFVPLSSGEVMAVDLESGKVVATAKSAPQCGARQPGLLSRPGDFAGLDGLELYYQVDAARDEVARRLAANPDDVEGLTLRGEMLLDAGKSTEAVADFRRAYSLDKKSESHGRTRELLRDALLAGLRDDFAAHRSMAGEVEPLLDDAGAAGDLFPLHGGRPAACRRLAAGRRVLPEARRSGGGESRPWKKSTARILSGATAGSRPGWACFAAKAAPRPPPKSIAPWNRAWKRPRRTRVSTA